MRHGFENSDQHSLELWVAAEYLALQEASFTSGLRDVGGNAWVKHSLDDDARSAGGRALEMVPTPCFAELLACVRTCKVVTANTENDEILSFQPSFSLLTFLDGYSFIQARSSSKTKSQEDLLTNPPPPPNAPTLAGETTAESWPMIASFLAGGTKCTTCISVLT